MKNLIIFFLLLTIISSDDTVADSCTTNFNGVLSTTCTNLDSETSSTCYYSDNKCQKLFTRCSEYPPTTTEEFDEKVCNSIKPINDGSDPNDSGKYKCVMDATDANNKKCVNKEKVCSEHEEGVDNCIYLKAGDGQRCVLLSDGKTCQAHYDVCENLDSTNCEKNIPVGHTKKCTWDKAHSKCITDDRICEDGVATFTDKNTEEEKTCFNLKKGDNQRCISFNDGTCQTHYNSCGDITTNKDECEANYPNTGKDNRCKWTKKTGTEDEYECTQDSRYCEDYIENYSDEALSTQETKPCIGVNKLTSSETGKVCLFENNEKCYSYYESCSAADGDKDLCATIKPLNDFFTGFDEYYKCEYDEDEDKCEKVKKECTDYDKEKGKDESEVVANSAFCSLLNAPNTDEQKCFYDSTNNKCEAKYITCSSYNNAVTDATKRERTVCEAITPRDTTTLTIDTFSYCVFTEDNNCEIQKKPCKNIIDQTTCNAQTFGGDASTKRCLYLKNNTCIETYRTCEDYTATEKLKDICELIEPSYGDDVHYNCTFSNDNGVTSCTKTKIEECESFKERLSGDHVCSSLSNQIKDNAESVKYKCTLKNNKCVKDYFTCTSYDGKNKGICESITLEGAENIKCILENDKTCTEGKKLCSEYKGQDALICSNNYVAVSPNKDCAYENNKCIEKYPDRPIDTYAYCSQYRGSDKEECEKIQPYKEDSLIVDTSARCVYNANYGCLKEHIKCSEAKTELECISLIPEDTNKQCAFVDTSCVEQYKTCDLYYQNEETINKDSCENIKINLAGDATIAEKYSTHYCKYTASTTQGQKSTCVATARKCAELIPSSVKSSCTSYTPGNAKKCVYENDVCFSKAKTCLELKDVVFTGVELSNIDEICSEAKTSSDDYTCEVNDNENGCVEKKKNVEPTPGPEKESDKDHESDEDKPDDTKQSECKCSAEKQIISKIILALLICFIA